MSSKKQENHTGTYTTLSQLINNGSSIFSDHLQHIIIYISIINESNPSRYVEEAFSPAMFSTLEDGKIVRGLAGIPSEGPVLIVGYHMMLGLELAPLIANIYAERRILVRGVAHPMMFNKLKQGRMPALSNYDTHRLMGAVPVSPTNLFKLLKLKSHILLYPGGMREALHRKVTSWFLVLEVILTGVHYCRICKWMVECSEFLG